MSEMFNSIMSSFDETIKASKAGTLKPKFITRPVYKYNGEDIKRIRDNLGLTQLIFADILGVSKKTVEAWESNRSNPSGPALRMMELLNNKEISINSFRY